MLFRVILIIFISNCHNVAIISEIKFLTHRLYFHLFDTVSLLIMAAFYIVGMLSFNIDFGIPDP